MWALGVHQPTQPLVDIRLADCAEGVWAEGPSAGAPTDAVLINGMTQPTISLVANRWYRRRRGWQEPPTDT